MLKALLAELLEDCTNLPCDYGKIGKHPCWACNGTGKQLSQSGKELFEFLKQYGDFATSDHTHTLS